MLKAHLFTFLTAVLVAAMPKAVTTGSLMSPRSAEPFVGYLLSTFRDSEHAVEFHLSNGNDPLAYTYLNGGQPVLRSTVGTGGVRDMYLVRSPDRTTWYLVCTDLDIRSPGFSWDEATRRGSKSLVVWTSSNLVDWTEPRLVQVEAETAGMAWAPSVVYDATTELYNVFWSSRQFAENDPEHTGQPVTLNRIRYATTSDFTTFSTPKDYHGESDTSLIDQEFQHLGGNSWVRNFKNETTALCYQEVGDGGIFGEFIRTPGSVETAYAHEGAAMFADNTTPGRYYLLLDDYQQYIAYQTDNIRQGGWSRTGRGSFPTGTKHGVVTPLTQTEYDNIKSRYGA